METMQRKQLERWDGVDAYIIRQTMMGHTAPAVMVRTIFEDPNGNEQTTFMPASPTAVQSGQCVGPEFGGTCTGDANYLQTAPTVAAEAMGIPANAMPAAATPAADRAELEAAQDACLERKIAEAREAQKKKRGFGKLLGGIGRVASRFGDDDLAADVAQTLRDVYDANATASDLSAAAKDLGLTESEIEACRNPT